MTCRVGMLRRALGCALALATAPLACSQVDPPLDAGAGDDYFPLADGAYWVYAHANWTERVEATALPDSASGEPMFLLQDSPNPSDDKRSDSRFVRTAQGRVLRVDKTIILAQPNAPEEPQSYVTYDPGFLRFNAEWVTGAADFQEEPSYSRTERDLDSDANSPARERRHLFRVVDRGVSVKTPLKTFRRCIRVLRTKTWQAQDDDSDAPEKLFWFCQGVGKVREENLDTGSVEELIDYRIP